MKFYLYNNKEKYTRRPNKLKYIIIWLTLIIVINIIFYYLGIFDKKIEKRVKICETIKKVIIPAALPGIIGSFLLAVSRAIGETMIVVMAAGLVANLTANPLEASTTITTQIVVILIGDQEFDSPKTMSAFALGLTLFVMTLILNFIALRVVKKYTEKYE